MCLPGNSVLSSTKEDHQNKLLVTCYLSDCRLSLHYIQSSQYLATVPGLLAGHRCLA